MAAENVAKGLRAWAIQNGLMMPDHVVAGSLPAPAAAGIPAIPGNVVDVLREKAISYIGFNEAANEVVVYTTRAIAKKVKKTLPQAAAGNVTITYRIGSPAIVGKSPHFASTGAPASLHNGFYACGSSIHVANRAGAGTLGCLVRLANGTLCGLSNSHVTASCNYAQTGLPIVAPGPVDALPNGVDPFCVGHHERVLTMTHGTPDSLAGAHISNLDVALFKIKEANKVSSIQRLGGYDTPSVTAPITPGTTVSKAGRTSGLTSGIVRAQIAGAVGVTYKMPELDISLVVFYEPVFAVEANTGYFSRPGDSGSLVTWLNPQNNTRYAVGLVFAGDDKKVSFVLPIEPIIQQLGVTIVSGHNV
jgi:hypothetical protein